MTDLFSVSEICRAEVLNGIKPTVVSTDEYEIIFVNQGEINTTCDAQVLKLEKGMLALYKPLQNRSVCSVSDGAEYISVCFKSDSKGLENNIFMLSNYPQILIGRLIELIGYDEIFSGEFIKTLELLLICILREEECQIHLSGNDIDIFANAVTVMQERVKEQLSVEVLAEVLGVSLSKLKRIFSQYSLIGVHEYFLGFKVSYAKQLLSQGESVTRVSELAGFNNQNYFSSSFKRVTGISPKDYISVPKKKTVLRPVKENLKQDRELPSYLL